MGSTSSTQLKVAVVAALAVPTFLGWFSGFEQRAFDSYVHMFFADHYAHDWFQLWEPRWYGGFWLTSYPPLAHQFVALASRVMDLETAFRLVTAAAMVAMPFAVGAAARALFSDQVGWWATLIAALLPTSYRFAYVYGQLAMVVAAPFALWGIARLDAYCRFGRRSDLVQFGALVGACAGAHHLSVLFAAGGCVLVALNRFSDALRDRTLLKRSVFRLIVAALVAAVAIAAVIWPFFKFAQAAPQVEIPHFSRDPLWLRSFGLDVVEQCVLCGAALILCVTGAVRKSWAQAWLAAAVLLLLVVSMGDTTILPKVLFRSQWRWLTYDKFQYWGSLLFAALLAQHWASARSPFSRVGVLSLVTIPLAMMSVGHKVSDEIQPEFVQDISEMRRVLNGPEARHYRHLTLGFGDQFVRLDLDTASPNIDGNYHTARGDERLRKSGIGTLDSSKYYSGTEILEYTLARASETSLRWVFVTDLWYEPFLLKAGFQLQEVWPNGVTLYEKTGVPPLPEVALPPVSATGYAWGFAPLSCVVVALCLEIARRRGGRSPSNRVLEARG